MFLLHAGIAVEHLLKAHLAELNPALLARQGHTPSMLWFADESQHSRHPPQAAQTIGMSEALSLAIAAGLAIGSQREHLDVLRNFRNGVSHLGVGSQTGGGEVLPSFLAAVQILATGLRIDHGDLFGPFTDFVATQLDEHRASGDRHFDGRVEQARMRFQQEHADLSIEGRVALRTLIQSKWARRSLEEQLVDCPVCGLPAHMYGHLVLTGWAPEYDSDRETGAVFPVVEYQAPEVHCPTCGLVLDTPDLVQRSAALENWHLPEEGFDAWVRENLGDETDSTQ